MASMNDTGERTGEFFQAQFHLYRLMGIYLVPMSIKWAINLGIPDIIHNHHGQSITLAELLSALKVPQEKATYVHRIMRLLAHNGIFAIVKMDDDDDDDDDIGANNEEQEEKEEVIAYALTPISELLVKGTDHCLTPMVEYLADPTMVGLFHHLGKWTYGEEKTIIETALGSESYWDFVHQNPAQLKLFNEAMESDSNMVRLALRECKYVFEGLDTIVDVGGGTGNVAKIISQAFPMLKCAVLDLPHVAEGLTGSDNLKFVGGNMFKSIPQADAILLKWILHDWSDDYCLQLLKNCKEAASGRSNGGKVIIIDIVINEKEDGHEMIEWELLSDLAVMTMLNAKGRDEKDWKRLFLEAGFGKYKIFPILGYRSLIELYP